MKSTTIAVAALAIAGALFAGSVSAKPALKDQPVVRDGIIATGIAYEISQKCGSISARTLRGLSFLNGLRNAARDLGYTDAEIDAYTGDKDEKKRLEAVARAQLADMGATVGDEASYCAVGRAEIAAGTDIGRLLR